MEVGCLTNVGDDRKGGRGVSPTCLCDGTTILTSQANRAATNARASDTLLFMLRQVTALDVHAELGSPTLGRAPSR